MYVYVHTKTKLHGLSPVVNYTDWQPLVGEVSAKFLRTEGVA
jgi:hypothetical protein